jgi:polyisoprenoid-binding protein YceI
VWPFLKFLALVSLTLPVAAPAQPVAWTIDPDHSVASFTVRHMLVANVRGEFAGPTGTISFDPQNIAGTLKAEAAIDARTVNTRNADRDRDLKSDRFFAVAKYPTITFRSRRAEAGPGGHIEVTGDLVIRGVTKEVVLDVEGPTAPVKDPWGNVRAAASASSKINRQDFGVKWNATLDNGGVVVGDDVNITVDAEMIKQAAKSAN